MTGYEPELSKDLALDMDDTRLDEFQGISDTNKIAIGLGLPIKANTGVQIAMVVFQPGEPRLKYSKQQLHADELPYFEEGEGQIIFTIKNKKIAPAICYESLRPEHAATASNLGAEIYVASVAKSQKGIDKAMIHYPHIAKQHAMPVLMSNCVGGCDNFLSVGSSAVWTKQGKLVGQLDDHTEGLIVFDTENEEVTKVICHN